MSKMISVASGFQYSVNIGYDLSSNEKLKNFIPTKSSLGLLEEILLSTAETSTERSRVLIGAYGKGKSQVYNQNVMGDRVIYSQEELQFNFRLIMLLDKDYEPNEDERIDKAFKHMGENPDDEARFDSYVRGGVDVLYEKLIEGVSSPDEYVTRLYDFIEEFQEKFNDEISSDDILKLCSK